MPYRIHAEILETATGKQERGTGTVDDAFETEEAAVREAQNLRDQGFTVTITTPDGRRLVDW